MEMTEMEQLVDLVRRSGVRELTLKNGETRITLKKNAQDAALEPAGGMAPYYADAIVVETGSAAHVTPQNTRAEPTLQAITSPLVGIFHHAKPMVGVGAKVREGQVVAAIEAMKLHTEVNAPTNGVVVDCVIEDGMPAEYGQTLFLVQADPKEEP